MKIRNLGLPPRKEQELILLRIIAEAGGELRDKDAILKVIECFKKDYKITDEQIAKLSIKTCTGLNVLKNNIRWVRKNLVIKGELDKQAPPKIWRITDKGKKRLKG